MKPGLVQIAPSILAADMSRLGEEIQAMEKAGADVLHFDIMDGHFVPNITFGFPVLERLRKLTKLPFDAHLMIEKADQFIDQFNEVGCDWISVHVEACPHIHRTLQKIREHGKKAGVAINPGTALSSLDGILDEVDYILVMSVNPGFGGQKFIPNATERIGEVKKKIGKRNILIEVDGGVKKENAKLLSDAGAQILVMGTGLFAQKDYKSAISSVREALA